MSLTLLEEKYLPSMVAHQMLSREQSVDQEEFTSSMAAHRLSRHEDTEDVDPGDPGEDSVIVSEFSNITNMIEKLSREAVEDVEQHDIVNVRSSKPSNEELLNLNGTVNEDKTSADFDSTMSTHGLSSVWVQEDTQKDEDTSKDMMQKFDKEAKLTMKTYEKATFPTSDEDEDDFDDSNAVVYSCTLGDNLPVIIQTVGNELIEHDEEEEEEDFAGEPVESKLVISFDGKISEINIERSSIITETKKNALKDSLDPDQVLLNENYAYEPTTYNDIEGLDESASNSSQKKLLGTKNKKQEDSLEESNNEMETIINDQKNPTIEDQIFEDNQNIEPSKHEEEEQILVSSCKCKGEKDKIIVPLNIINIDEENKEIENPLTNVEDKRRSVSQDPKRKRKIMDILFGCFKCTKKAED